MNQSKQDLYKLLGILVTQQHEAIEHMYAVDEVTPASQRSRANLEIAQQTVLDNCRQMLEAALTMRAANDAA